MNRKRLRTRSTFGASVRSFFARRSDQRYNEAKQYLTSLQNGSDALALIRARSEDAEAILRSDVFQESILRMNEQIVAEIAQSDLLDDQLRTVLFLKLQLVTDHQQTLMTYMNDYETMATIREAERRQNEEDEAVNG